MSSEPARRSAASDSDPTRVLLATTDAAPPAWTGGDGRPFELRLASGLASAIERLGAQAFDVVVVDAALARSEAAALERLREARGRAALLLRSEHYTSDLPTILRRLGGAACVLPAGAPDAMQAQLVSLAANHASLTASLAQRVAELEQRTLELEQSRTRFRDVIERNADAILVVGHDGLIRFANPMAAELFQRPREALVDSPFGFPVVLGEATQLDLPHNGHARVVEMRVVESEWESEAAYIASLRDITERKRAEEDARRLIREQAARAAAETAAHRFRFLAEASTRLSLPLDDRETLSTLARLCIAELAEWAIVYGVEEDGRVRCLEVAHRDTALAEDAGSVRNATLDAERPHPVLEVLRTREPLLVDRVDDERLRSFAHDENHLDLLRGLGVASYMIVPLVARDHELGAIGLIASQAERPFTPHDLAVARELALRAALALDNARLYREAQQANQAKSDLLAVISHDLRTPLNAIMGHAELLAMGIPEPLSDASLERVVRIRLGASHLLYLIDELLSFARLEAGREELRLREVDAVALAREVAAVVEPLAQERSLTFDLEVPREEPVLVRTDPDRLRQVLLNLVGNAVKYTEQGGARLVLRADAQDEIEFRVHDTGVGIRPDHLERIFEPFWQVEPGYRGVDGGTGLGLSVVRRLVRLLGGSVTVDSVVGRGSTFTVRLPRGTADL